MIKFILCSLIIVLYTTVFSQKLPNYQLNFLKLFEIRCNQAPYKMGPGEGSINIPAMNFEFDSSGNIYINDGWGNKIIVVDLFGGFIKSFPIFGDIQIYMSMDKKENIYIWDSNSIWIYSVNGDLKYTGHYREIRYKEKMKYVDMTAAPSFSDLLANSVLGCYVDSLYWTGKIISVDKKDDYINLLSTQSGKLNVTKIDYRNNPINIITLNIKDYIYLGEPEDYINVWHLFINKNNNEELNFIHSFNDYYKYLIEVNHYYFLISSIYNPSIIIFDQKGEYLAKVNLKALLEKDKIKLFSAIEEPIFYINKFSDKAYMLIRGDYKIIFYQFILIKNG